MNESYGGDERVVFLAVTVGRGSLSYLAWPLATRDSSNEIPISELLALTGQETLQRKSNRRNNNGSEQMVLRTFALAV